jgi:hypothetical protein
MYPGAATTNSDQALSPIFFASLRGLKGTQLEGLQLPEDIVIRLLDQHRILLRHQGMEPISLRSKISTPARL